jgi:hypothetical protein
MKAFVSYSVSDNNEFILTLLAHKLREKNFVVNTSQSFYSTLLDFGTMRAIDEAQLFIGIITGNGNERSRVLKEWEYTKSKSIPNLLLIEDTVPIQQPFLGNYVRFNRRNPQQAIEVINHKMSLASPNSHANSKNADDLVPWILGGTALLAILALFSKNK